MTPTASALFDAHVADARLYAASWGRRLSSRVRVEELESPCLCGLWEASRTFDGARNVRFKTWAEGRMRGRVLDYLRGLDPAKRRARQLLKAGRELGPRLAEALRVRTPRGYEDAGRLLADKKSGAGVHRVEDRDAVDAALSVLPRRTALMVRLHYLHGWTHGRLARWMGVSASRVCQVLTRARPPMRARLEGLTL